MPMSAARKPGRNAPTRKRGTGSPLLHVIRWLFVAVTLVVLAGFAMLPVERAPLPPREGPAIGDARSWGYQLQHVRIAALATGADVLVVDYSRDGSEQRVLQPAEIERLRIRADGSKRIVLAYMSIGEAENYRFYWRRRWKSGDPAWIGPENAEWKGNFPVRYWMRGWRDVIMRPQITLIERLAEAFQPAHRPYLDRILAAGFDGVYLDRVDAFDVWAAERKTAPADMIAFVREISAYAKRRRPGFLVVPQNGEELLRSGPYREAIDAVAKEDLLFGLNGDGQPNAAADVRRSQADLDRLKAAGRPVFVVEYLKDPAKRAEAQRELAARGYIGSFADRDLKHIPE